MKNIGFKSVLLALAGCLSTSCGDFLEIYPLDMVYEDNYWNEKADVDQIMNGVYVRMQQADYMRRLFVWGEVRSDNINQETAEHVTSGWDEYKILREDINSKNSYTNWSSFYSVINTCNIVIQRAPEVAEKDPTYLHSEMLATQAEATALRALSYFYLVRTFKDVPYNTEAITTDDQPLDLPVTDGDQILKNCIADLKAVIGNAVKSYGMQGGKEISYGRITQDVINMLIADMSLWIGNFDEAATYAQRVIDSKAAQFKESSRYNNYYVKMGEWPLIPDNDNVMGQYTAFNDLFYTGGSKESIFELAFASAEDAPENELTSQFFRRDYKIDTNKGRYTEGVFKPLEALLNAQGSSGSSNIFADANDTRVTSAFYVDDPANPTEYYITKYVCAMAQQGLGASSYTPTLRSTRSDGANWIIYRVSDAMLVKAEALIYKIAESNGMVSGNDLALATEAFNLIKTIEDRSSQNLSSSLNINDYQTKSALLKLLYLERRREFLFEGKRWFDLVRWSKLTGTTDPLVEMVTEKYTKGNSATAISNLKGNAMRMYWPYNYDERRANPNLQQNPAYPETSDSYDSTN